MKLFQITLACGLVAASVLSYGDAAMRELPVLAAKPLICARSELSSGSRAVQGSSGQSGGFQLGNGSTFGLDYVAVPPAAHLKRWQTSACVSTPAGSLNLGKGFSIQADALAGVNIDLGKFDAGYALDLAYSFKVLTVSNSLNFQLKAGAAQLYGAGLQPKPGFHGSASVVIALRG